MARTATFALLFVAVAASSARYVRADTGAGVLVPAALDHVSPLIKAFVRDEAASTGSAHGGSTSQLEGWRDHPGTDPEAAHDRPIGAPQHTCERIAMSMRELQRR